MDNREQIVLTDAALEREAEVAFRFAFGGCLVGFLMGAGAVALVWGLS